MSNIPRESHGPRDTRSQSSLAERVRQRVAVATARLEHRDAASPGQPPVAGAGSPAAAPASPLSLELKALRRVFRELAKVHQRYRRRTGEQVPPGLRSAARAFRQEPSIISLVPVAGYLDELHLLRW